MSETRIGPSFGRSWPLGMVGVRDLKAKASEVLRRAEAGEVVVLTRHGKAVAVVLPVDLDVQDFVFGRSTEAIDAREAARRQIHEGKFSDDREFAAHLAQYGRQMPAETQVPSDSNNDELRHVDALRRLEDAILAGDSSLDEAQARVHDLLARTDVYVLGHPAGEITNEALGRHGTESDVLHFSVKENGTELVLLPLFTRPLIMAQALMRNPEWQTLSVLRLHGRDLLDSVADDVALGINPWSRLEFLIPPRASHVSEIELAHAQRSVPAYREVPTSDAAVVTVQRPIEARELAQVGH